MEVQRGHLSMGKQPTVIDKFWKIFLCLLVLKTRLVWTYPGGAPDVACESMFPSGHSSAARTEAPPYAIVLDKTKYEPGETIKVEIESYKTKFKGLYVQARRVGCQVNNTETIGVFTILDPLVQTRHCFGIANSAVTHTSSVGKSSVSFYWTAPVIPSGHVVIRATIVKDVSTFWQNMDSSPMIDLQENDTPFCLDQTPNGYANNSIKIDTSYEAIGGGNNKNACIRTWQHASPTAWFYLFYVPINLITITFV